MPGDGEGRNGVWLAQQGHHVTSVDASSVGLQDPGPAAERGVQVTTALADLAERAPQPGFGGPVAVVYLHLPSSLRTKGDGRPGPRLETRRCADPGGLSPEPVGLDQRWAEDVDMLTPGKGCVWIWQTPVSG